jgi:hypothetical protein
MAVDKLPLWMRPKLPFKSWQAVSKGEHRGHVEIMFAERNEVRNCDNRI